MDPQIYNQKGVISVVQTYGVLNSVIVTTIALIKYFIYQTAKIFYFCHLIRK